MKGKMKKFLAFALALVMCLGMTVTASAAANGKIIVTNVDVKEDTVYSAYQIFGATSNGTNLSYTATSSVKTYLESQTKKDGDVDTHEIYFEGVKIFTLLNNDGGNTTYVRVDNAQQASKWVQANISSLITGLSVAGTATATKDTQTIQIEGLADGYYYVLPATATNDSGSVVMLTSVGGNAEATVVEKHGTPGFGEPDPENPDDPGKHAGEKTVEIGGIIDYTINYTNALNYEQDGTPILEYHVVDNLASGTELDGESLKISVNGEVLNVENKSTSGGIDVTIPWATQTTNSDGTTTTTFIYTADYQQAATIKIEYSVKVTANVETEIENTVTVTHNGHSDSSSDTVYTGTITINKYETGNEEKKLAATFVVQDTSNNKYLKVTDEGNSWVDEVGEATSYTTDAITGSIEIKGLKKGTYNLIETVAPQGYNLLDHPVSVILGSTPATDEAEESDVPTAVNMEKTADIANSTGTLLPSTGGIGTTIFYVVGGILVVCAGVLLITKKRMSKNN